MNINSSIRSTLAEQHHKIDSVIEETINNSPVALRHLADLAPGLTVLPGDPGHPLFMSLLGTPAADQVMHDLLGLQQLSISICSA